ncbi:hypothetical protein [Senimuribacter intestinalis]|uniref:hypothetical protein n=1 Tax=Senimuribacter intestinalis TaxID=2941507 RepID=UPI00203D6CC8|nr:hypothetical protein [Senimuribacter intestinalis]
MKKSLIKKLLLYLVILAGVFVFCACGDAEVTLQMGETSVISEKAEITPKNVLVTPQVYAPLTQNFSMGWEAGKDESFVVVEATVKNLAAEDMTLADICAFRLERDEETFTEQMTAAVDEGGKTLTSYPTIKAGKESTVYFVTKLEESETSAGNMIAAFAFDTDKDKASYNYRLPIDTSEPVAVYQKLELKEKVIVDGLCELTPGKLRFTTKIEPENPGYFYNYFKASNKDEKLLVLYVKVKNLSSEKKDADSFYGVRIVTEDGENYIGNVVADDENKANITSYEDIGKGKKRGTYGMASIPKAAGDGKCSLYLYAGGNYYLYEYEK